MSSDSPVPDAFEPAFVLGTGRCGSTLVHEILARHAAVSFLSNFDDLDRVPWNTRLNGPLYRQLPNRLTQKGRIRFAPSEGYRILEREVSPMLTHPSRDLDADDVTPWIATRLDGLFRSVAQAQDRHHFLHKFTGWPRAAFLDEIFPRARYIHVVRDGRAVANSWLQMPWWRGHRGPSEWHFGPLAEPYRDAWEASGRSFVALAGIGWLILLDAFDAAEAAIGPDRWLQVRYEDVVGAAADEIRRMIEFLGLPWTPVFAASVGSYRFSSARRDGFRSDLTASQVKQLDTLLGERLERLGYSLSPPGAP
jgi:hypothetical protein